MTEELVEAPAVADAPTRHRPSVSLEEADSDSVVLRINATPLRAEDGAQLAEAVLGALRRSEQVAPSWARRSFLPLVGTDFCDASNRARAKPHPPDFQAKRG